MKNDSQYIERIRKLSMLYLEAGTDDAEELELKKYFLCTPRESVPEELHTLQTMFRGYEGIASAKPARRKTRMKVIVCSLAACAAAAAILVGTGRMIPVYGYDSDGRAIKDKKEALEQTKYFSLLSELETSISDARMLVDKEDNRETEKIH